MAYLGRRQPFRPLTRAVLVPPGDPTGSLSVTLDSDTIVATGEVTGGGSFLPAWQRRVALTIDHTKVGSGGVSDFTVYLTRDNLPDEVCSPTDPNRAQSNGGDLRFSSDVFGANVLPLHIDAWEYDTTDGSGDADIRLHVLVPALSSADDTPIYLWYHVQTAVQSQPAVDAVLGSRAAWDDDHCHRYSLDEAPGGTAPQFLDSISDRHATVLNSGATSVTGQTGPAFSTGGTASVYGPPSGFVVPNGTSGLPFTCTGSCYIPADDCLAIANFDDAKIHEINKTTGAQITSFSLTDGPALVQGVAWNPVAQVYAVMDATGGVNSTYFYQRNGTFIGASAWGYNNTICYDFTDNVYWVRTGSGAVRKINTGTGATIATITFTGAAAGLTPDGITHNVTGNTLYITVDSGNMIYEINKTTGATIQTIKGPLDLEHPAYDHTDDALWACGDGGFHSTAQAGQNIIYKLTPAGEAWSWRTPTTEYSVEFWAKPTATAGTTVVFTYWAAVITNYLYCEIQSRASGVLRIYTPAVTSVDTATSTFATGSWQYFRLTYDAAADTLTLYKGTTQVAQATSVSFTGGPDARIGMGARANGLLPYNGALDDVRFHKSSRSTAWWSTRYANASAPSSFLAAGSPLDVTAPLPWLFRGATQTLVGAM